MYILIVIMKNIIDILYILPYIMARIKEERQTSKITMKTTLRRCRFERGELSQQQLANMVSVSRQTIVSIEGGDYAPSVKLALLLAEKLDTKVEELFCLEDKDRV